MPNGHLATATHGAQIVFKRGVHFTLSLLTLVYTTLRHSCQTGRMRLVVGTQNAML
jgi:hypothetical protein